MSTNTAHYVPTQRVTLVPIQRGARQRAMREAAPFNAHLPFEASGCEKIR